MKREYCCPRCGLIWFDITSTVNSTSCKECGNTGLYACDTMGYVYAYPVIEQDLKERGKEVHFDKEHPYYGKK